LVDIVVISIEHFQFLSQQKIKKKKISLYCFPFSSLAKKEIWKTWGFHLASQNKKQIVFYSYVSTPTLYFAMAIKM